MYLQQNTEWFLGFFWISHPLQSTPQTHLEKIYIITIYIKNIYVLTVVITVNYVELNTTNPIPNPVVSKYMQILNMNPYLHI